MQLFRFIRPTRLTACACAAGALLSAWAYAQEGSPPITKIEEDWQLVVGTPSPEENAPQVFIVTCPTGDRSGVHSMFELNHVTLPDYFDGGLQLQTWTGDTPLSIKYHPNLRSLATPNEVVKFTISMKVYDGWIRFKVLNGTSTTWGPFGGDGLTLYRPTNLDDLSRYSAEKSVEFSRVGFAAHRVESLVLKQVRYYAGSTLVKTESESRPVFQSSDLSNVGGTP